MKYVGSGSPIAADDVATHHEPLERHVLQLHALRHRGAGAVGGLDHRGLGLDRQRVRQVEDHRGLLDQRSAGVLADRHQARLVGRQQHRQALRRRHDVVVHQPDPVEALRVRRADREVEAARPAEVLLGAEHLQAGERARGQHVGGVVGGGVVDHDHRVGGTVERGQAGEHPRRAGRRGCRSPPRSRRSRVSWLAPLAPQPPSCRPRWSRCEERQRRATKPRWLRCEERKRRATKPRHRRGTAGDR